MIVEMEAEHMKKNKKILLLCCILVVILAAGIGGFLLIQNNLNQKIYREKIEVGDKKVLEESYGEAIVAYKEALEKHPKESAVYEKLSNVYVAVNDYVSARRTLSDGYKKTKDEKLRILLNDLDDIRTDVIADTQELDLLTETEEIEKPEAEVDYLKSIGDYFHSDYVANFGQVNIVSQDEDLLTVSYENFPGEAVYENVGGVETSFSRAGKTLEKKAYPKYVVFHDLTAVFPNFGDGIDKEYVKKLIGFAPSVDQKGNGYYMTFQYEQMTVEIACDRDGVVSSADAENYFYLQPVVSESDGTFQGMVKDATDESPVKNASLVFKDDSGREYSAVTDSTGSYSLELPKAVLEVMVSAEGYIEEETEIDLTGVAVKSMIDDIYLSPSLGKDEIRIVLTWGSTPRDLDAHLVLEMNDGRAEEICYYNRDVSMGTARAVLDLDDTDGGGPETITVQMGDCRKITYGVVNYSAHGIRDGNERGLADSQAVVKVYMGNKLYKTYTPPSQVGVVWYVLEMTGNEVRTLNEINWGVQGRGFAK